MKKLAILLVLTVTANTVFAEDPVYFADENLKAAVEEALGITDPAPSDMLGLTYLDARQREIVDLTGLEHATNLTFLDLHNNQISNLSGLSGMSMLTTQLLHRNQISDLSPLANLTNLTSITLQNNQISDISPLSVMNSLTSLYLYNNPLDCPAYDIYIPIIETNNPGIYITYNPRPAYCDYQPDIDVSPLVYDFGDVELETASSILITILNYGNGDLSVQSLTFTPESSTDFTVTLSPELPSVIAPEGSIDVEVTFAPSTEDILYAVLEITNDDPDEPVINVNLVGVGVVIEVPPSEQIEQILEFFDISVADGTLVGVGPGNSASNRLKALRNMLKATSDLIVGEYFEDAYEQLVDVLKKCDGQVPPPDFVSGEATEELANKILELMEDLEGE